MSIALARKRIHCPNCHYEGKAKVKGTGSIPALLGVVSLIIGIFAPPVLLISALFFLVAIFRPADQVCPKCKWPNPIPLSRWEKENARAGAKAK